MHTANHHYLLKVGEQGSERLALLNTLFEKTSRDLLLQAGLREGQTVLEVGCGTGNMICWIAECVGPSGKVYGIDSSHKQLELAERQAKARGVNNITFLHRSIAELTDLPSMDVIYSRFVIMHVHEPVEALKRLIKFLKVGGTLVCEEATPAIICCYPSSSVFQKHRECMSSLSKKSGHDFDFGDKIYSYFRDLGLENIFVNFVQPILKTKQQKRMIPLAATELKSRYLQYQIATEAEIDALLKDLYTFIEDDRYLVSCPRTTQIYGQRINNS